MCPKRKVWAELNPFKPIFHKFLIEQDYAVSVCYDFAGSCTSHHGISRMKTTIKHCRRCGAYDNISVKKCSNCGNVYYVTRKPKKKNETGNRAT